MKRIRIRDASCPVDGIALETVRGTVFVKEQNVPRHLEFDGMYCSALHWLALTPEDEPVGTLRRLSRTAARPHPVTLQTVGRVATEPGMGC